MTEPTKAIPRYCAKTLDDILTGLDNGAHWVIDQIGVLGLLCLSISGVLAWLLTTVGG